RRRPRRRGGRRAHPRRHRCRGVHPRPAEPRRGLPQAHRAARGGADRDRRGGRMSTAPTAQAQAALEQEAVRKALSSIERPEPASGLRAALTFGWRGMLKVKHVPEQLLDVTLTPVMFTLMFTYLFGGAIEGSTQAYLQYVLPGVLV